MERAAAGEELLVERWGHPYVKLTGVARQMALPDAA
jgi:antitoxin (DNA-binding transcriptional repressor) of toxin-antitoxin stability system